MSNPDVKHVVLNKAEILLAYAIVRVMEVNKKKLEDIHYQLSSKLHRAKHGMLGGITEVFLSDQECKLMRQYNTDYCDILATQLEIHDKACSNPNCRTNDEAMAIYERATKIQMQLASLY